MPKREKRLTKRERQEKFGKGPTGAPAAAGHQHNAHIHCISCGRHLDEEEFDATPQTATWLTCAHGSTFASCMACTADSKARLEEHDRTGQPPRIASAWH
jgi:hypothetical protein